MIVKHGEWNPATHPYIAYWNSPAPYPANWRSRNEVFATPEEAIAAITAPFTGGVTDAYCCGPYNGPGRHMTIIARRKRKKAIVINSKT